jgi:hypothetical protein
VVAHPENTVGHAVHLRQERLGNHCDSHDSQGLILTGDQMPSPFPVSRELDANA